MQYLLLIYDNEKLWGDMSKEESQKLHGEYTVFTNDIKASGHFVAGDALQPVATATTVRVRNGKTQTTDGPFAETKEQLGGYYLINAKDLDEACKIAERIPSARIGSIEVRPVMVFNMGNAKDQYMAAKK
ncbi:MAG TPA: YciI family protein [Kofleriaceae bacterium]|nr:YciI family protein [Kofleriaceae bacterium]